ncbi:MAG: penicillin-binding protein 2 [Planctomycetota bacterium]
MSRDRPDAPPAPGTGKGAKPARCSGPYRLTDWSPAVADLEQRGQRRTMFIGRSVVIVLSIILVGLLGRVYQLQAYPSPLIAELRDSQTSTSELAAMRGALTDRNGRVLAATRVAYRLFCDPSFIEDRGTFSEQVAFALEMDPVKIEIALWERSRSLYVLLSPRLTDEQVEKFHEAEIKGIFIEPVVVRDYPQGGLAGTLLGFTGTEGFGLEGLERRWEDRLAAKPGRLEFLRDNRRRPMWVNGESYVPYDDGDNIRLSIDAYLQKVCEEELLKTIEHYGADSGQIIIMQPHTGEILAIATFPSYDPNNFLKVNKEQRRNRPVTEIFEPGSIFKPFIWAGLTEMGAARPNEMVDCTTAGSWRMPNGRVLGDVRGKGLITWHDVLKYSSNIGMARIAQRRSVYDIHDIMVSFGFGQKTGIGLPGEERGIMLMHDNAGARSYSHGSWPMGQEVGVTGIQLVRAMSVLANGGVMVQPTIEAYDPSAEEILPPRQRVVSKATAHAALAAMRDSVTRETGGTGTKADSPFYDIFGKTGTAEIPDLVNGGYYSDRYTASFLGGAPADRPRIVVGCFISNPDPEVGYYGGTVAGPAVRSVVEKTLLYLGVPTNPGTNPADILIEEVEVQ